jgi:hypothetical protein
MTKNIIKKTTTILSIVAIFIVSQAQARENTVSQVRVMNTEVEDKRENTDQSEIEAEMEGKERGEKGGNFNSWSE